MTVKKLSLVIPDIESKFSVQRLNCPSLEHFKNNFVDTENPSNNRTVHGSLACNVLLESGMWDTLNQQLDVVQSPLKSVPNILKTIGRNL